MAGQGTFIAYQPLRPTELKVGDLVSQSINDMIKRGEAQKAAKLKLQQEQGKNLYEMYKDIKFDPLDTVAPLQNSYNKIRNSAIDVYANAKARSLDYSIPYEQRISELQKAQRLANQVKDLSTFMTSKEDIEAYNKNLAKISSNNAFVGDPMVGFINSIKNNTLQLGIDNDNDISVSFAPSPESTSPDSAYTMKLSALKSAWVNGVEDNLLNGDKGLISRLNRHGKDMVVQQERNTNGVTTYKTIKFDRDRAINYLKSSMGYSTSDDFDINSIPKDYNQLFFNRYKSNISKAEDLDTAINLAANIMESGAKEVDSIKQSKTDTKIALEKQQLINAKLSTQQKIKLLNKSNEGNTNAKLLGDGTLSISPVIWNTQQKDGKRSYEMQAVNYFVKGNSNLGKQSKVGITAFWNPVGGSQGTGAVNFGVNLPTKDGKRVVMEKADLSRVIQILSSNKVKNPQAILSSMSSAIINDPNLKSENNKFIQFNDNFNVDFSPIKPKSNYTYFNYHVGNELFKELQK
ncbi:hypothetical protein [Elizabethkingia meningoseptica]|uniref:hypothetical protein n=1 Tax=Elizabethkingia meningoseptica TaxID=238 RepID=UPI0016237F04|nr:hypothetical protein [Elizabethkingia meningoseptica]